MQVVYKGEDEAGYKQLSFIGVVEQEYVFTDGQIPKSGHESRMPAMSFFDELKRRNVVRVAIAYLVVAWLVAQVADLIFESFSAPPLFMRSLLIVLATGLPIVIIFAWAFEITPEGIKKERDVDRSQSVTQQTGRKLDRVIIGVMAVIIAFFVLDRFVLQHPNESIGTQNIAADSGVVDEAAKAVPEGPSIAVLPFVNMSSDTENEYFSDGLTETLLNMLAQLPDLRVAARTSSFAFKGKNTDISEIARALGVAHLLEGSVQKSGDQVRVTAQLIRADDGFHVWSHNYTRPLTDIFVIQDEIAADVARVMGASLLGTSSVIQNVSTTNLEAYDIYLQGLQLKAEFTFSSLPKAESLFRQALVIDPAFTEAKLELIATFLLMRWTGQMESLPASQQIEPLLEQIRASEPDNRLARALELDNELYFDNDLSREEMETRISEMSSLLPLLPTQSELRSRQAARIVAVTGDFQRALNEVEAGLIVDPLDSVLYQRKGQILRQAGRFEEALESLHRADDLKPDDPNVLYRIYQVHLDTGDIKQALNWQRKAVEADPFDHEQIALLAIIMYQLKLTEEGDRWAAKTMELAASSAVGRMTALYRAAAHDNQQEMLGIAKNMISDQVSARQGAFETGLFVYTDTMSEMDQAKAAYDFLLTTRPDLADFSQLPSDYLGGQMQSAMIMLMYSFAAPEDTQMAWQQFSNNMDKSWPRWRNFELIEVIELIINGKPDEAERVLLEKVFSQPVTTNLERTVLIRPPFFESINQRPEVTARVAEIDAEVAAISKQVSEMLLEPEWNP